MESNKNSRRDFLKQAGFGGVGLAIGFSLDNYSGLFNGKDLELMHELTPFILINQKGEITLVNPNPDMGQGSTQAVPALIAEELEVRLEKVKIIQSDGNNRYGVQISGGSGSVRRGWEPLRKAGAAAKEMLIKAASQKWNVPIEECVAEDGAIIHPDTGNKLGYGDLIEEASTFEVPQDPILKPHKEFKIIGKATKRLDVRDRITGKAVFGIDIEIPDMVIACIKHSPGLHDKVGTIDDGAAKEVEGVLDVIKMERPMPHRSSEAVAVIATNYWSALQGREKLKVEWVKTSDNVSIADYSKRMEAAIGEAGLVHVDNGRFEDHFNRAGAKLEEVYETHFLSHVPMEPENATVHVKEDGTVEVWAPVQAPGWARGEIAEYLGIIPERIKMHVTLLGGAFGRKAYHDFLLEACCISKKLHRPVKVIWSREDDISQGPYRPGLLSHLQGTYTKGRITGFHHHAIGESIDGQVHDSLTPGIADPILCGEIDFENSKYGFDFSKISYSRVATDIPIVWWRSVYASNFAWGQECFLDELANHAGTDPLDARVEILTDPRYRNVLQVLAEKSAYYQPDEPNSAKGIAIWKSFESICAACITVKSVSKGIKVDKVVSVIDCGTYVNPDMVRAQTEGNIIMGLSAATKEEITFSDGACDQINFHQYQIMRISEIPQMEIHIIESTLPPGGVGEPGLPPIAPALGNAIYNLTGKRIRKLPVNLSSPELVSAG